MNKSRINLLKPELFPKKPWLTLNSMVFGWSVLLVAMVLFTALSQHQVSSLTQEHNQLLNQNNHLQNKVDKLEQQLLTHKKSPKLESELTKLKAVVLRKQQLQEKLTDHNDVLVSGFSMAMAELSTYHHNEISLVGITIKPTEITLSGNARNADIIPLWLAGFTESTFLANKKFSQLLMQKSNERDTQFIVSSAGTRAVLNTTSPQAKGDGNGI